MRVLINRSNNLSNQLVVETEHGEGYALLVDRCSQGDFKRNACTNEGALGHPACSASLQHRSLVKSALRAKFKVFSRRACHSNLMPSHVAGSANKMSSHGSASRAKKSHNSTAMGHGVQTSGPRNPKKIFFFQRKKDFQPRWRSVTDELSNYLPQEPLAPIAHATQQIRPPYAIQA